MNRIRILCLSVLLAGCVSSTVSVRAQVVAVTMSLDTNRITSGNSTTLHVYAQVLPAFQFSADQIVTWCVDVLNSNGAAAGANYAAMVKAASDNFPSTSATGTPQGANRDGIYDTFLNLPHAGVASPVELMSIPVTGITPGNTRFSAQAGSSVPLLGSDFLVAPLGGGTDPLMGGVYNAAFADLQVVPNPVCLIQLTITPLRSGGGPGGQLRLDFSPCPGQNHYVEFSSGLGTPWQTLPGSPHNSGSVTITNNASLRFYRVRVEPVGGGGAHVMV